MKTHRSRMTGLSRSARYFVLVIIAVLVSVAFAPPRPPRPKPKPALKYKKKAGAKKHVRKVKKHRKVIPRTTAVPIVYGGSGGTVVVVTEPASSEDSSAETAQPTETTTEAPPTRTPEPKAEEQSDIFEGCTAYEVLRMEDEGMTLVLSVDGDETAVRMLGLKPVQPPEEMGRKKRTPEGSQNRRPQGASDKSGKSKPDGHPIAIRAIGNIIRGESVYVVYDETVAEQDEDGNFVAYLYRAPDGMCINEEIVRQGFALADDGYSYEQSDTYKLYQTRAQLLKKGLWQMILGKKGKTPAGENLPDRTKRTGRPKPANN